MKVQSVRRSRLYWNIAADSFGWQLVAEWPIKRKHGHPLRLEGALVDEYRGCETLSIKGEYESHET